MAVLVEALSIVIRRDKIIDKVKGGWEKFLECVPNQTLCFDDYLARVGFMAPPDVKEFADKLQKNGLDFVQNNRFIDFAVVDQREGPTRICDWLDFFHITFFTPPMTIAACELVGSRKEKSISVAFPTDWDYERSLSKHFQFVPNEEFSNRYKYLRTENGVDVIMDLKTGKEVYIGRSG